MPVHQGRLHSISIAPFDGESASDDGLYRYSLRRSLPPLDPRFTSIGSCHVVIIGKNPSTANATDEDPTSHKFAHFARKLGGTRYTAVNLYAFRSPDPGALAWYGAGRGRGAPEGPPGGLVDVVGPSNDGYIQDAIMTADVIWCAWGSPTSPRPPMWEDRIRVVAEAIARRQRTRTSALSSDVVCLGRNKDRNPRHPCYLRNDTAFEAFS